MKKSFVSALIVSATLLTSQAHALSTVATTARSTIETIALSLITRISSEGTSLSSQGNAKIILAAQDDAANLIASNGEIRGEALKQALETIRAENPTATLSDLQLAEVILKVGASL